MPEPESVSVPGRLATAVVLGILGLSAAAARAEPRAKLRLDHADRLEIDGRGARASGRVRLRLGGCRLSANALELSVHDGARVLVAEQVCLELAPGRARLSAHRLRSGPGGALKARWVAGELCRCGAWPALGLRADEAWSEGAVPRRLHLRWPVLSLGPVPLLAAPYWAVPLRPGTSGLLWPRLGHSARDGIRFEQGVYLAREGLADLELAAGLHQGRGPHLRSRLRWRGGQVGAGELALLGIVDGERGRVSAVGWAAARGRGWQLGLFPDLVSDGELLRDTAGPAARVFAPYLRSRLAGLAAWGPLSATVAGDLFHDLVPVRRSTSLHGAASAELALAPVHVAGPLVLLAEARWLASSEALLGPVPGVPVPGVPVPGSLGPELSAGRSGWLSLLELSPALAATWAGGPLRATATARYQLQLAWRGTDPSARRRQLLWTGAELGLPLARRYATLRHGLEPFIGWRSAHGDGRWTVAGGWLEPRRIGVGLAGVRTRLGRLSDGRSVLRARLALAAGGEDLRLALGELSVGRALRLDLTGTVATGEGSPRVRFDVLGRLCAGSASVGKVCGGYLRQRLGLAELLSPAPDLLGAARSGRAGWSRPSGGAGGGGWGSAELDWLYAELGGRLGPVEAGVSVYLDPLAGELTHGLYRLSLGIGCGCYRLSALGRSRRGQRWPDLMLGLSLSPKLPRCLLK